MARPVVVCNVFPDDNKGGCAITLQTIAWLKRQFPSSPIWVVPVEQSGRYDPDSLRFTLRAHPDVRVLRSPIRSDGRLRTTLAMFLRSIALLVRKRPAGGEFERLIADAALVVSKGGYVFVERDTIRNLLSLWFTAFPLIYAAATGVPTVVLCSTVGPFRRMPSRAVCRRILGRVDLVVTRDPISTAEARALGRADAIECPDIVLGWDARSVPVRPLSEPLASPGRYAVVVPSGRTRRDDAVFLERLGRLARRILDEGLADRLVVPLQSREDAPIASKFVASLDDPRCVILDEDLSPEELMGVYRGARFLVGRRLHAGLFAMMVGTPAVLFATDGVKANGVMGAIGFATRVAPYPEFDVDEVHRRLATIVAGGVDERTALAGVMDQARARVAATLEDVSLRFQPGAGSRARRRERVG